MPKRSTVTKAPPETLRAKANRIAIERDRLVAAGKRDEAVKLVAGLNTEIRAAKAKMAAPKSTTSSKPKPTPVVAKKPVPQAPVRRQPSFEDRAADLNQRSYAAQRDSDLLGKLSIETDSVRKAALQKEWDAVKAAKAQGRIRPVRKYASPRLPKLPKGASAA